MTKGVLRVIQRYERTDFYSGIQKVSQFVLTGRIMQAASSEGLYQGLRLGPEKQVSVLCPWLDFKLHAGICFSLRNNELCFPSETT